MINGRQLKAASFFARCNVYRLRLGCALIIDPYRNLPAWKTLRFIWP
ncbi:hypothetical protein C8D96_0407 [Kushneria marisflavi]|nr:hypothetical protein C8D96_0407 [Kushneria marisflavi]